MTVYLLVEMIMAWVDDLIDLPPAMASKKQRHVLHRFEYPDYIVQAVNTEDADYLIKLALKAKELIVKSNKQVEIAADK